MIQYSINNFKCKLGHLYLRDFLQNLILRINLATKPQSSSLNLLPFLCWPTRRMRNNISSSIARPGLLWSSVRVLELIMIILR